MAVLTLYSRLFQSVDIGSVIVFRVCFGLIMFWEVGRYLYKGWIGPFWIAPQLNFTFHGFDWVAPWPGDGMYLHFLGLGVLALCIASGFCYRLATILFFPGFAYVLLLDKTYYLNHFYLITILSFLLIFVPAHRAFSIDAWRNPKIRSNVIPAWAVWALALQIAIPYFYGGIAKLKSDWLILGEPMRTFLATATSDPDLTALFTAEPVVYFFAWGGMLFDLAIPFLLWWPRSRTIAFLAAVVFHLTNAFLFHIGIFPWFMICASTLFFSPGWPRKFGFPPTWKDAVRVEGVDGDRPAVSWHQKAIVAGLGIYFVGQLVFPFYHHLYTGNVNWTREGMYFTWHMRIADVAARGKIVARDRATGETWEVDPTNHLNTRQAMVLFGNPDMILQYAHFLAREAAEKDGRDIEVRAEVVCSLNRRPARIMIDPAVDLTTYSRSWRPASFIIPFDAAPLASDHTERAGIDSGASAK